MKRSVEHDMAGAKNPRLSLDASGGMDTVATTNSQSRAQHMMGMPAAATSASMVPSYGMQQGFSAGMTSGGGQYPSMASGLYSSQGVLNSGMAPGVVLQGMGALPLPYAAGARPAGQPAPSSWSAQAAREGWMFLPPNMNEDEAQQAGGQPQAQQPQPHQASQQGPHEMRGKGGAARGGGEDAGSKRSRGNYKCSKCGLPKKGHICAYQPKLRRRDDEGQVETVNAAVQAELDPPMTVRELDLGLQGTPESYNIHQDMNVATSVNPAPSSFDPITQGILPLAGGGVLPALAGGLSAALPDGFFQSKRLTLPGTGNNMIAEPGSPAPARQPRSLPQPHPGMDGRNTSSLPQPRDAPDAGVAPLVAAAVANAAATEAATETAVTSAPAAAVVEATGVPVTNPGPHSSPDSPPSASSLAGSALSPSAASAPATANREEPAVAWTPSVGQGMVLAHESGSSLAVRSQGNTSGGILPASTSHMNGNTVDRSLGLLSKEPALQAAD